MAFLLSEIRSELSPHENGVSIIIPTYNSGQFIGKTIHDIILNIKGQIQFEIIVVNDCSTDNTLKECGFIIDTCRERISVIDLKNNSGIKVATLIGLQYATYRYAVTFDDDLQFKTNDIMALFREIRKNKIWIVTGNYERDHSQQSYTMLRRLTLMAFNWLFFRKYRYVRYYTSFKIFDMVQLRKNKIVNIYYMWEIPPCQIHSMSVTRKNSLSVTRNGKFYQAFRLVNHAIYWITLQLLLLSLPLLLILFYDSMIIVMLTTGSLLLFFFVLLYIDKARFKHVPHEVIRNRG